MQLVKKEERITIEDIFSKLDSYDIYKFYLPEFREISQPMQNPWYHQQSPSFSVYMKNGKLYHGDFSPTDDHHGDCMQLVQQLFNLDKVQAIQKVAEDFGLADRSDRWKKIVSKYVKPVMDEKRYCLIQVLADKWSDKAIGYWAGYGIGIKKLKEEEVYPVKEYSVNRRRQYIAPGELAFAYRYREGFKVYLPERCTADGKWKSNIPCTLTEGVERLNGHKTVIVSKSKKDRCVLENVLPHTVGVINTQNESLVAYTEGLLADLSGRAVLVSYDSDAPGKKASRAITEKFGWKHVNVPDNYLPNCKDWADVYKSYGPEVIIEHFKSKKII